MCHTNPSIFKAFLWLHVQKKRVHSSLSDAHVSGAREFTRESDPIAPAGVRIWLQVQPLQPPCRTSSKGH